MTLACNPIVGHISTSYAVRTSVGSAFCSQYDFNAYSYQSNLQMGCELWRKHDDNVTSSSSKNLIDDNDSPNSNSDLNPISTFNTLVDESEFSNVIKASTSINDKTVKLLWEGRYKEFLISTGIQLNFINNVPEIKDFGIKCQFSS